MKKQQGSILEGLLAVIGVVVVVSAIAALFIVPGYALESASCKKKARMMGLESDYGWMTGCMVQVGDRYAPIGYIRIVDNKVIIQGNGEE